ncbi:hypothetical protein LF252_08355 [Hymenobacter sp. BT728]|nr:hypothetical protein [Hymenobacter pini]
MQNPGFSRKSRGFVRFSHQDLAAFCSCTHCTASRVLPSSKRAFTSSSQVRRTSSIRSFSSASPPPGPDWLLTSA